jgi:hypothetical protein
MSKNFNFERIEDPRNVTGTYFDEIEKVFFSSQVGNVSP